jgi:hypothetical protein
LEELSPERLEALWLERLGTHRDWQENLYFTALFVLRALLKAGDFLLAADYRTGSPGCEHQSVTRMHFLQRLLTPHAAQGGRGHGGAGARDTCGLFVGQGTRIADHIDPTEQLCDLCPKVPQQI